MAPAHTTVSAPAAGSTEDAQRAYRALTSACALVDRSERGKLALGGSDAVEFLNGQVTNDVAALAPGEGCYAAFLTHKGKMLGDLRVLLAEGQAASEPGELLLDTERSCLQALFDLIHGFKVGYDVQLHKRTLERSLLSLVGPGVRDLLEDVTGGVRLPRAEHAHLPASIAGVPTRLIVTSLPDGVDVLLGSDAREIVLAALLRAGAQPVDEAAYEVVRVEHGRPRYGVDLDDSVIPQEAGLNERAVSFVKGCYVGQETVARLHYRGKPNRHLRGLRMPEPISAGAALRLDGRSLGVITSSVLSPVHGPIGLALVRREAEPGVTVEAGEQGGSAIVVELPFTA